MKNQKKLYALLLVITMMLTLSPLAFADPAPTTGKITIENVTKDKVYHLYKVFDATTATVGGVTATAYTYSANNATFTTALGSEDSPFTMDTAKNVTLKEGKDEKDIATFLTAQKANLGTPDDKTASDNKSVSWTGKSFGLYLVIRGDGGEGNAAVTITTVSADATILDKNQKPGSGGDNFKILVTSTGEEETDTSINYGDKVYWKITCNATNYDGEDKITKYVVTDKIGTGFSGFSIDKVKVDDKELASTDYNKSATDANGKTVLIIPWVKKETSGDKVTYTSLYDSNAVITVECSATAGSSGANYTNSGLVEWYGIPSDSEEDPEDTPNPSDTPLGPEGTPPPEVKNNTYSVKINKYYLDDESKQVALGGAKFVLADGTGDSAKYYKLDEGKVTWVAKTSADVVTTGTDGSGSFAGLANGTYYLYEDDAPKGYNKLKDPITATINNADSSNNVENKAGNELPATGGRGTTMLLTVGGLLFVGAAVVLVTKKRMYNAG